MTKFSGYSYYIVPIENLPSIYRDGILSFNKLRELGVSHSSFALPSVQERRDRVKIPNGMILHEYVPTYFNPRNATLFYIKSNPERIFSKLCILVLDAEKLLRLEGVVISDRNASTQYASFSSPSDINHLNFDCIYAKSWNCPDEIEKNKHKAEMSAEILVPNKIDPAYILAVLVQSDQMLNDVHNMGLKDDIQIKVNKPKFFL